jgi:hypothetical protein
MEHGYIAAAAAGDLARMHTIHSCDISCSFDSRVFDSAIAAAARNGHRHIVDDLLSGVLWPSGLLNPEAAFIAAAEGGHLPLLTYLTGILVYDMPLSTPALALKAAAANGHLDVVRYLVGIFGMDLADGGLWLACSAAESNGQEDVALYLRGFDPQAAIEQPAAGTPSGCLIA